MCEQIEYGLKVFSATFMLIYWPGEKEKLVFSFNVKSNWATFQVGEVLFVSVASNIEGFRGI